MKTLEAIQRLLKLKGKCSLAEIASVTEQKKAKVLQEITDNQKLLKLNKAGQIVGFINVIGIQSEQRFKKGEVYKINSRFGQEDEILCNDERVEVLETMGWYGYGSDSYRYTIIKNTKENREKLESEFGILNIKNIKTYPIEYFWDGPNLVINLLGI